jgi:DNA (cytosine-5)-methyltransferase 1
VGENVRGLTNWNGGLVFDEVQADLETQGYEVLPFLLPACAVNAPHRRDRIWFIAFKTNNKRGKELNLSEKSNKENIFDFGYNEKNVADTNSTNSKAWSQRKVLGQSNRKKANGYSDVECRNQWKNFPTQSPICNGDDGISTKLDGITFSKWRNESIKAGGNAIVPQVALQIFKAIEQYDKTY